MKQVNSYLLQNCNCNFILKYINAVQLNMNKFKMDRLSIVPQYKKMSVHYHKQMNYKNIYTQLIERSRTEKRVKHQGIYYEEHHIVPKCLGGTNDPENLVLFTAREHFIAHWLLTKIYPNEPSIIFAFTSFSMKLHGATNHTGKLDEYSTSKNYEYARRKVVDLLTGKPLPETTKQSLRGTTYINNGTENKRIKVAELQKYLETGWIKGRKKFKRKSPTQETRNKISLSNTGRKQSESQKEKLRQYNKRCPHCWVSKDGKSLQVYGDTLQTYLNNGWIKGRHQLRILKPEDVCYLHKNNIYVQIPPDQKQLYLNYGWVECSELEYKDRTKNIHQNTMFKFWVHKDNKSFRICEEQIEIYKQLGYNIGRGKRRFQ